MLCFLLFYIILICQGIQACKPVVTAQPNCIPQHPGMQRPLHVSVLAKSHNAPTSMSGSGFMQQARVLAIVHTYDSIAALACYLPKWQYITLVYTYRQQMRSPSPSTAFLQASSFHVLVSWQCLQGHSNQHVYMHHNDCVMLHRTVCQTHMIYRTSQHTNIRRA